MVLGLFPLFPFFSLLLLLQSLEPSGSEGQPSPKEDD